MATFQKDVYKTLKELTDKYTPHLKPPESDEIIFVNGYPIPMKEAREKFYVYERSSPMPCSAFAPSDVEVAE